MLGPPDTVVELGETEVSEEIFMEYLSSLGESTYRFLLKFIHTIYNYFSHNNPNSGYHGVGRVNRGAGFDSGRGLPLFFVFQR